MISPEQIISSSPNDLEFAERALTQRPRLSIRLRVALGFAAVFLLICIMTIWAVVFMSKLGAKQLFIEKAGNYTFEIQQARRFEKNFLLYGTDIDEALVYIGNAQKVLNASRDDFYAVIGEKAFSHMSDNLDHYRNLLERLGKLDRKNDSTADKQLALFQNELRRSGAEMVADAASAVDKERLSFHSWLRSAKIIAASVLLFTLIFETFIVIFITWQIFLPFKRFENYMRRIAAGDFSPVTPVKWFRDEFTNLAVAVNRMLKEIQDRGNQLMESRKIAAIGTLTEGIAHELNNPLNNISLTAESLIDDFKELPEAEKIDMIKEIFGQVERAGATVANLLDFTQRDQSSFKPLDLQEVLASTAALLKNELLVHNITLKMDVKKNLPPVNGHKQNLQHVFLNLFLNAKEAMPRGGELEIRSYRQENFIRVEVRDTGEGIEEKNLSHLFDPFFTTKEVGKGTGLSLSASFGIIDKHHGTISVKSEVGKGTIFTVSLPAITPE